MIEINAKFPNGKIKTYMISETFYALNRKKIIYLSEKKGIYLRIYSVRSNGRKELTFDSLFLQIAAEVECDNFSIKHA